MQDPVRLSDEEFRSIYQQAFESWTLLHRRIVNKPELPSHALFPAVAQDHPTLPLTLDLEYDNEGVFATGFSTWTSVRANCTSKLPSFQQYLRVKVAVEQPNLLMIPKNGEKKGICAQFAARDSSYLSVLVLAWSYILSARWTETLPGSCAINYTQAKPTQTLGMDEHIASKDTIEILLVDAEFEEVRWWAAVLAPGQGWKAQMGSHETEYMSPWSVNLQADCRFVLRHAAGDLPSFAQAAKFKNASRYLEKFCTHRNIVDQSWAALAAVLLLPSMSSARGLSLPFPSIGESGESCFLEGLGSQIRHCWTFDDRQVDKLITLSCNTRGIRPMLLSTFYEPSIECNAVTPWLQGTSAAIDYWGQSDSYWITRMCMERAPAVAFLWLGVIVLDLHQSLLQGVRFGQIPIDLHSAAWSRTTQSFIQDSLSSPLVANGNVSRADECRLLFLSQSGSHARSPLCQWKPFGTTAIEDTDLEVRDHWTCGFHQLRYEGVSWKCQGKRHEYQPSTRNLDDCNTIKGKFQVKSYEKTDPVPSCFTGLDRDREAISENATRNMFEWLRSDGFARNEADIWKHEWFESSDSDDSNDFNDESSEEKTSGKLYRSSTQVLVWLSDLKADCRVSNAL
jgi:hypothetical protein